MLNEQAQKTLLKLWQNSAKMMKDGNQLDTRESGKL
jgi:hypothetical protein